MTNSISGEITLRSDGEEATTNFIPLPIYRELHKAFAGSKDVMESFFSAPNIITIDDAQQVWDILDQWLSQYNVVSVVKKVSCEYRDIETGAIIRRSTHNSVNDFVREQGNDPYPASRLILYFSIVTRIDESSPVQTFDIAFEFNEFCGANEMFRDSPLSIDEAVSRARYSEETEYACKLRIEFSEYITATTLKATLESWYKGLKRDDWKRKKRDFVDKLGHYFQNNPISLGVISVRWLPIFVFLFSSVLVIENFSEKPEIFTIALLCLCVVISFTSELILRFCISRFEKSQNYYYFLPVLNITRGNEKIISDVRLSMEDREKSVTRAKILIVSSIMLPLIVGVVANAFSYYLF